MTWHYQMRARRKVQDIFEMIEVYSEAPGEYPTRWSENGIMPCGETREELIDDLTRMLNDAKKYPVLVETEEESDAIHSSAGEKSPEQAAPSIDDLGKVAGGDRLPHL